LFRGLRITGHLPAPTVNGGNG